VVIGEGDRNGDGGGRELLHFFDFDSFPSARGCQNTENNHAKPMPKQTWKQRERNRKRRQKAKQGK